MERGEGVGELWRSPFEETFYRAVRGKIAFGGGFPFNHHRVVLRMSLSRTQMCLCGLETWSYEHSCSSLVFGEVHAVANSLGVLLGFWLISKWKTQAFYSYSRGHEWAPTPQARGKTSHVSHFGEAFLFLSSHPPCLRAV